MGAVHNKWRLCYRCAWSPVCLNLPVQQHILHDDKLWEADMSLYRSISLPPPHEAGPQRL